jgi:hypothetical protein
MYTLSPSKSIKGSNYGQSAIRKVDSFMALEEGKN